MRKLIALLFALFLLAGCGMQTRYTLLAHVADFLDPEQKSGEVESPAPIDVELYLPDDDGDLKTPDQDGHLVQLVGKPDAVEALALTIAALVTETGGQNLELTAGLYLAEADADAIYIDEYKVTETSLTLAPKESGTLTLNLELSRSDPAFSRIGEEGFRVGVKLTAKNAKGFRYELKTLDASLTTRRLGEILR